MAIERLMEWVKGVEVVEECVCWHCRTMECRVKEILKKILIESEEG